MARTTIPAELVAINAIQGTLIADNAITAVHIATNAVSGTLVADNAITSTHIAQNNVTATQIAQNTITVTQLADSAVETAKINNDAVTQAKIADDAVGPDQLAVNAVVSASIANGTIVAADLADNAVTLAKMASLARGSIIYGDSAGDPAALSIGSNGTVLKSDGTDVSWGTVAGGVDGISTSADATAITITSGEHVLIGVDSEYSGTSANLTVKDAIDVGTNEADEAQIRFTRSATTGVIGSIGSKWTGYGEGSVIKFHADNVGGGSQASSMTFHTNNNNSLEERMKINNNGTVGIGSGSRTDQMLMVQGAAPQIELINTSNSYSPLSFVNKTNTNSYNDIASIGAEIDSGNAKGRLVFKTRNTDGSGSQTERMRIDADGKVGMSGSLRIGSNGISGTTAISGEILRLDSAGDNTPLISMVQANARLAAISAYYSNQENSNIALWPPEGSTDRTAVPMFYFHGEGQIKIKNTGGTIKEFLANYTGSGTNSGFVLGGVSATATNGTGNIHSIHFIQSGKITWGDWTDANALGVCEGSWNQEGTDRDYISFHHRNSMNWYGNSNGQTLSMATGGGMSIKGSLTQNQFSDMRLKRDIVPLESVLDKVNSLDVFNFNYMNPDTGEIDQERNRNTGQIGLSAQQTEKLFPEVVEDRERIEGDNTVDNRNWKYLEYEKMTPILVKAVQELTAKVKELEEKLEG